MEPDLAEIARKPTTGLRRLRETPEKFVAFWCDGDREL